MRKIEIKKEIETAFERLIDPLKKVTRLESYTESHEEYGKLLAIILNWENEYERTETLAFINHIELLDVYEKLNDLSFKWVFDPNVGDDFELSDEIVICFWELMLLRKEQIEQGG